MLSQKVTIKNPAGLHLRPAGLLCQEAMKYQSQVSFLYGPGEQAEANAKSILSVLGACIRNGDTITLICDGEDEVMAMSALIELITDGLGDNLD